MFYSMSHHMSHVPTVMSCCESRSSEIRMLGIRMRVDVVLKRLRHRSLSLSTAHIFVQKCLCITVNISRSRFCETARDCNYRDSGVIFHILILLCES